MTKAFFPTYSTLITQNWSHTSSAAKSWNNFKSQGRRDRDAPEGEVDSLFEVNCLEQTTREAHLRNVEAPLKRAGAAAQLTLRNAFGLTRGSINNLKQKDFNKAVQNLACELAPPNEYRSYFRGLTLLATQFSSVFGIPVPASASTPGESSSTGSALTLNMDSDTFHTWLHDKQRLAPAISSLFRIAACYLKTKNEAAEAQIPLILEFMAFGETDDFQAAKGAPSAYSSLKNPIHELRLDSAHTYEPVGFQTISFNQLGRLAGLDLEILRNYWPENAKQVYVVQIACRGAAKPERVVPANWASHFPAHPENGIIARMKREETEGLKLFAAIEENNLSQVEAVLKAVPRTALMFDDNSRSVPELAVRFDRPEILAAVLSHSRKVTHTHLTTALQQIKYQPPESRVTCARLLLAHGANADVDDPDDSNNSNDRAGQGKSLMLWAACNNDEPLLRTFLEAGAKVDGADHSSKALRYALEKNDLGLMIVLLEHGANPQNLFSDTSLKKDLKKRSKRGDPLYHLLNERVQDIIQLDKAITNNQIEKVKQYASQSVLKTHPKDLSFVARALAKNRMDILEMLITCGISFEANQTTAEYLALIAIQKNHPGILQALIKRGMSIKNPSEKNSWLSTAVDEDSDLCVVALLRLGADINVRTPRNKIYDAMAYGSRMPKIRDEYTRQVGVLIESIEKNDIEALLGITADSESLAQMRGNPRDAQGRTLLSLACEKGRLEIADEMLRRGAEPDVSDRKSGRTPLMNAAWNGHASLVSLLLENKASANIMTPTGWSGLRCAVDKGHTDVVRILLDNHVNPDLGAPLATAVFRKNALLAELLLNYNARPDIAAPGGETPLTYAAARGDIEMIRLLFQYKASPDIPNTRGKTAAQCAISNNRLNVLELLLENGVGIEQSDKNIRSLLAHACHQNRLDISRELIARGARLDVIDNQGWTLLHLAVDQKHKAIVDFLLEAPNLSRLNLNAINTSGHTVLMRAAAMGDRQLVQRLLAAGADAAISNKKKQNASLLSINTDNPDLVRLLLATGINNKESFRQEEKKKLLSFAREKSYPRYSSLLKRFFDYHEAVKLERATDMFAKRGIFPITPENNLKKSSWFQRTFRMDGIANRDTIFEDPGVLLPGVLDIFKEMTTSAKEAAYFLGSADNRQTVTDFAGVILIHAFQQDAEKRPLQYYTDQIDLFVIQLETLSRQRLIDMTFELKNSITSFYVDGRVSRLIEAMQSIYAGNYFDGIEAIIHGAVSGISALTAEEFMQVMTMLKNAAPLSRQSELAGLFIEKLQDRLTDEQFISLARSVLEPSPSPEQTILLNRLLRSVDTDSMSLAVATLLTELGATDTGKQLQWIKKEVIRQQMRKDVQDHYGLPENAGSTEAVRVRWAAMDALSQGEWVLHVMQILELEKPISEKTFDQFLAMFDEHTLAVSLAAMRSTLVGLPYKQAIPLIYFSLKNQKLNANGEALHNFHPASRLLSTGTGFVFHPYRDTAMTFIDPDSEYSFEKISDNLLLRYMTAKNTNNLEVFFENAFLKTEACYEAVAQNIVNYGLDHPAEIFFEQVKWNADAPVAENIDVTFTWVEREMLAAFLDRKNIVPTDLSSNDINNWLISLPYANYMQTEKSTFYKMAVRVVGDNLSAEELEQHIETRMTENVQFAKIHGVAMDADAFV